MGKSDTAFRTISEVAGELDIPQHVLRFWEGRFNQIKPLKRAGGRRYYRPEDVELLRRIRDLLYSQGYTIKGVQKLLRERQAGETLSLPAPAKTEAAAAGSRPAAAEMIDPPKRAAAEQLSLLPATVPAPTTEPGVGNKILLAELLNELLDLRALLAKG